MGTRKTGEFIADILEFSIEDGVVRIWAADLDLYTPLPKFRRSMARAAKALAEHDDRKAVVVPLGKRRQH